MADINGKNTALYQSLSDFLVPRGFTDDDVSLVYSCFTYIYSGGKFLPGHRLITVVYKLTTLLLRKEKS